MNITLLLEMAAEAAPDRIGLVCDGKRWTYAQLLAAARGAAELIEASGASHVALLDESSEAAVIALFGAGMAGVPYCPLNYRLADADLGGLLDRIAPALIVGDVARVERLSGGKGHVTHPRADFVAGAQAAPVAEGRDYDDGEGIAVQLFTSGTTAAPKAAILKHSNLMSYILGTVEFAGAEEEDAALVCVPPYHIAGISALMSSIYAQRRIVMLPAFAPDSLAETGRSRARDQCLCRADHALADHRDASTDAGCRYFAAARDLLWRRQDAAGNHQPRARTVPRDRLHQRLRPDRDQLDRRPARPRRTPRGAGLGRPQGARPPCLGRPAPAHRRMRNPR